MKSLFLRRCLIFFILETAPVIFGPLSPSSMGFTGKKEGHEEEAKEV
jgi:hypothetical protein